MILAKKVIPKPGSGEAVQQGCTCPRMDNHHGKGYGGDGEKYGWVRRLDCPLHGDFEKKEGGE
jgi:hypothetical protein